VGNCAGVYLGGTKILAVIVGRHDRVTASARRATPTDGGPAEVCREIVETIREAAATASIDTSDLMGVGIGAPGAVDA
jgi:glucokinase